MIDEFLKNALRQIPNDAKRTLAFRWIQRAASQWLLPLIERIEGVPQCREQLKNGFDPDPFLMLVQLEQLLGSRELTHFAGEKEGRGAALNAARGLAGCIDTAREADVRLGVVIHNIARVLRDCVPMVRIGGRQVYARFNNEVYGWVLERTCASEEALERLLQCRDILEYTPHRTESIGFKPVQLDDALTRT